MTPHDQHLDPKLLGFWTRMLRLSSNLSQDALAAASGLTTRTIQRVESGARANLTTRRCLARGLGYDDAGIFDDPQFVKTVTSLVEAIATTHIREVEESHPDHARLEVAPLGRGAALVRLIDGSDAWCFDCDDAAAPAAQQEAACLFDNLRDYGDVWVELSHVDRLQAEQTFEEMLRSLARQGVRVYGAKRASRFTATNCLDGPELALTIAYVFVFPAEREISYVLVPKRGRMA